MWGDCGTILADAAVTPPSPKWPKCVDGTLNLVQSNPSHSGRSSTHRSHVCFLSEINANRHSLFALQSHEDQSTHGKPGLVGSAHDCRSSCWSGRWAEPSDTPLVAGRGVDAPDNTQFNVIITIITDHSRSGVGVAYNFGLVCLSVCMSVCQTIIFESLDVWSSY